MGGEHGRAGEMGEGWVVDKNYDPRHGRHHKKDVAPFLRNEDTVMLTLNRTAHCLRIDVVVNPQLCIPQCLEPGAPQTPTCSTSGGLSRGSGAPAAWPPQECGIYWNGRRPGPSGDCHCLGDRAHATLPAAPGPGGRILRIYLRDSGL